ncbi:hypothetical protein B4096_2022 [Heyndrickxia coagulans]|nr:hypothetical protein B4096_2022 [Heyndrickxia coagulans]
MIQIQRRDKHFEEKLSEGSQLYCVEKRAGRNLLLQAFF